MDRSDRIDLDQQLPDLAHIVTTLATDNARVVRFVDGLPTRIDTIVDAAERMDWITLRGECERLLEASNAYGHPEVSRNAQAVLEATDRDTERSLIRDSLLKLVAACTRVRMPKLPRPTQKQ